MSAREIVLRRIRDALDDVTAEPDSLPTAPRSLHGGEAEGSRAAPAAEELAARFADRAADYRARVMRCAATESAVREAIRSALEGVQGEVVVPPGLAPGWRPGEAVVDDGTLGVARLDASAGVVTGCAVAIAETGTVALDHGPGQGRRVLTLVPDLHVCVVRAEDLVAGVPEGITRLSGAIREGRPVTLISGPSATSDIELQRVEGVHGPRNLVLVVAA